MQRESIMPHTIDGGRRLPRRRRFFLFVLLIILVFFLSRAALSYYLNALWFGSLGYGDAFRKTVTLEATVYVLFFAVTFFVIYGWFLALRRVYRPDLMGGGLIFIGRLPVKLPVARILTVIVAVISLAIAAITGASTMADWQTLALYWYSPKIGAPADPIFGRPLNFYL